MNRRHVAITLAALMLLALAARAAFHKPAQPSAPVKAKQIEVPTEAIAIEEVPPPPPPGPTDFKPPGFSDIPPAPVAMVPEAPAPMPKVVPRPVAVVPTPTPTPPPTPAANTQPQQPMQHHSQAAHHMAHAGRRR